MSEIEDSWTINLKKKELIEEFGSSQPIRFVTLNQSMKLDNTRQIECLDCDAKSHAFALEDIHFDCIKTEKLKDALLFVLWNTDWPIGE